MEALLAACLSVSSGWYNTKLFALTEQYGSLESLYKAWQSQKVTHSELGPVLHRSWQTDSLERMEKLLHKLNIAAYTISDPDYPVLLKECSDPPFVLYSQGDISLLSRPAILSSVGTRMLTPYGKRAVLHLIGGLAAYPVVVVSGLALGVDAEVHKVCLDRSIPTVAVLGGGLDRYEPLTNSSIGRRIVAQGGCMVSEYPPGVRPQKHRFLERNRIIAGVAKATLLIEGKHHSGSLVTARYALSYGREVGIVPGDIFAPNSEAPLRLLKEGAWPITSSEDLLSLLGLEQSQSLTIKPTTALYQLLQTGPISLDLLCQQLALALPQLQEELTLLEIEGWVGVTAQGDYYAK